MIPLIAYKVTGEGGIGVLARGMGIIVLAAMYMTGLGGGFAEVSSCAMSHTSDLKCYCCASDVESCPGPAIRCCQSSYKFSGLISPVALLPAPPSDTLGVSAGFAAFIDTSARPLSGFDKLPEQPPAAS